MTSGCIADHFDSENNNNKKVRRNVRLRAPKPNAGKVKYLDPASVKECNPPKPKVMVLKRKPSNDFEKSCDPNFTVKKMPVQFAIPRKRPADDVNDYNVDNEKKPKVGEFYFHPSMCVKDDYCCGLRPTVKDDNGEKLKVTTNAVTESKVKRLEQKELGRNKSYLDKRRDSKVKYWDRVRSWIEHATIVTSKEVEVAKREKIKEAMSNFVEVYKRLDEENRSKPVIEKISSWRVLKNVAKIVRRELKWTDPEKVIGPVCGVRVGDKFRFRLQLVMIGLHCQQQCGIDYTNFEGKNLAISIVDSQRYSNERRDCDKLVYCGHGGRSVMGGKQKMEDQKLELGNLALKNSKDEKNPVRVIRKFEDVGKNQMFLYDGLYIVSGFVYERSKQGKMVYNFELSRLPGQPATLLNGNL